MEVVRRKCSFSNGIDVDSDGRSSGLSLGWRHGVTVTLRSFSRKHIDVVIVSDADDKT